MCRNTNRDVEDTWTCHEATKRPRDPGPLDATRLHEIYYFCSTSTQQLSNHHCPECTLCPRNIPTLPPHFFSNFSPLLLRRCIELSARRAEVAWLDIPLTFSPLCPLQSPERRAPLPPARKVCGFIRAILMKGMFSFRCSVQTLMQGTLVEYFCAYGFKSEEQPG
jgi:hypothetical protein